MGTIPPTNPLPVPRRDFDYRVIRPRELGMFLRDNSYCINIRAAPRLVRIDYWGPWSFEFRCRCWDQKIGSMFLAAGLEPMIRLSLHLWPGPRGTVYDA
ncbi:MAG TPA: hypothetical protein VN719_09445 [Gemmatimonadales bacterium]|nr:hypothetical protein [Gemmatimonadales bacterium]